jgi:hypothetical protein
MDLDAMITAAQSAGARTLLLVAGQPVAMRVGESVETPFGRTSLSFHQTQAWAEQLLSPAAAEELNQQGTVEVPFRTPSASGHATIFFGQGSHNIVLHLGI